MTDYGSLAATLLQAARDSASPEQGWAELVDEAQRHGAVPPELADRDVLEEVVRLRGELVGVLEREPVPPGIGCIHFGIFEACDEDSDDPVAGFYVGGAAGDEPDDAWSDGQLPYSPASRYFTLPLLDAIQAAPARGEYDPTLMRYALMFGAAALLARHATEGVLDGYALVVGFDEGDRAIVRMPSAREG